MNIPKYLLHKESNKEMSIKQEKKVQRQLASGSLWFAKGDLKDEECLYELKKSKYGKQFILTKEILEKHFEDSTKIGKLPIIIVEIDKFKLIGEVVKL